MAQLSAMVEGVCGVTSYCAKTNTQGLDRVVLQEDSGVYAFAFERPDSLFPEWDYLLDTLAEAKEFCMERWGVPLDSWEPSSERPNSQ
jgi:hypothetical protein